MAIAHRYRIEWQRAFPFAGWLLDHQLIDPAWNPETKTRKKLEVVIAAEKKAAEQTAQGRQGGVVLSRMDELKDFLIFDPKADRNDGSAFFRATAFALALSLPIWCLGAWL